MTTSLHRLSCEDRRTQILDVARKLFARKGFEGTTTREVAREAGVNEALIFRHFPSKQELYWAVVESTCDLEEKRRYVQDLLDKGGSPREVFCSIAERILTTQEADMTMMRLMFYTAMEDHELSERFFVNFMERQLLTLTKYVDSLVEQGVVRPVDTMVAVRSFFGMVIYHSMVQNLFAAGKARRYSAHEASQKITDLWLHGIAQPES
jgi:AcrR family transcriptional regulator